MFTDIAYAMGSQGAEGGQSGTGALFTMVIVFFIFYFILIRPQQKRLKEHRSFVDNIQKGDEVVTNGGMLGKVVGVTDKIVTLDVGEKLRIKMLKSSISASQKNLDSIGQQ